MRALPVLAVLFVLTACSPSGREYVSPDAGEPVAPHMIRLDPDALDPGQARKDARLALYRGDKSLLGTGEMNPTSVPGAPADWREADWPYGVRTIEDTADATRDEAHSGFYDQARRYADAYNRAILAAEPPPRYRRRVQTPIESALAVEPDRPVGRCKNEVELRIGDLNAREAPGYAQRLHAGGQPVLLGVTAYAAHFPGASQVDVERLGCLLIADTSDYQPGDGGFNQAALDYARAWNAEMLRLNPTPPRTSPHPRSPG